MKIKTCELSGKALNYAVAVADGLTVHKDATLNGNLKEGFWVEGFTSDRNSWLELNLLYYGVIWNYGGPVIEREQITVEPVFWGSGENLIHWQAYGHNLKYDEQGSYVEGSDNRQSGPTPLIAAMRCYVASKLGTEVEVPKELL